MALIKPRKNPDGSWDKGGIEPDSVSAVKQPSGKTFYFNPAGKHICGSRKPRTHLLCAAIKDLSVHNGRCHLHGRDSGTHVLVNGRESKIKQRLTTVLRSEEDDPRIWDMRRSLAVLSHALDRAVKRFEDRDTPEFRARSSRLFDDAVKAQRAGDADQAAEKLSDLGKLLKAGSSEDKAFAATIETSQKFSQEQGRAWRARLDATQVMNKRDISLLFSRIIDGLQSCYGVQDAQKMLAWMEKNLLPPERITLNDITPEQQHDEPGSGRVGRATAADAEIQPQPEQDSDAD
ncbi:MAG TPA: hypothetical protein VM537_14445 [Anaerolineae bacterium]|nr:hypothetical protein [Anaerolineae bacterium]